MLKGRLIYNQKKLILVIYTKMQNFFHSKDIQVFQWNSVTLQHCKIFPLQICRFHLFWNFLILRIFFLFFAIFPILTETSLKTVFRAQWFIIVFINVLLQYNNVAGYERGPDWTNDTTTANTMDESSDLFPAHSAVNYHDFYASFAIYVSRCLCLFTAFTC